MLYRRVVTIRRCRVRPDVVLDRIARVHESRAVIGKYSVHGLTLHAEEENVEVITMNSEGHGEGVLYLVYYDGVASMEP